MRDQWTFRWTTLWSVVIEKNRDPLRSRLYKPKSARPQLQVTMQGNGASADELTYCCVEYPVLGLGLEFNSNEWKLQALITGSVATSKIFVYQESNGRELISVKSGLRVSEYHRLVWGFERGSGGMRCSSAMRTGTELDQTWLEHLASLASGTVLKSGMIDGAI